MGSTGHPEEPWCAQLQPFCADRMVAQELTAVTPSAHTAAGPLTLGQNDLSGPQGAAT